MDSPPDFAVFTAHIQQGMVKEAGQVAFEQTIFDVGVKQPRLQLQRPGDDVVDLCDDQAHQQVDYHQPDADL